MGRNPVEAARLPGELFEEPTALDLLVHHAAGEALEANDVGRRGVGLIAALPPE